MTATATAFSAGSALAGTCSVSSAIATSSSWTSRSLSDWWRLSATLGLNLYVDSLAARHSSAGYPDHNNHAALRFDRVPRLEVVLHRWAALQSQALLEPALACGINGVREPRNPRALDLGQNSAVLARF